MGRCLCSFLVWERERAREWGRRREKESPTNKSLSVSLTLTGCYLKGVPVAQGLNSGLLDSFMGIDIWQKNWQCIRSSTLHQNLPWTVSPPFFFMWQVEYLVNTVYDSKMKSSPPLAYIVSVWFLNLAECLLSHVVSVLDKLSEPHPVCHGRVQCLHFRLRPDRLRKNVSSPP